MSASTYLLFLTTFDLVVRDHPLTAVTSFGGNLATIHKCISRRVYGSFSSDRRTPNLLREADIETSCDETETLAGSEGSDEDDLSASLTSIVNVSSSVPYVEKCLYRKCSFPAAPDAVPADYASLTVTLGNVGNVPVVQGALQVLTL